LISYIPDVSVREIEAAVAGLSQADMKAFAQWFEEFQADAWDRQIEADAASGKLDALAKTADQRPSFAIKAFDLGMKGALPSKAEIADEMFNRQ
jgi:hypothetical protein